METLRGLAIALVVAYHVGSQLTRTNPGVPETYRWLGYSLAWLRMPLFAAISGYVYALRPVQDGGLGGFAWGKLRRIGVPFIVVGAGYWLIPALMPDAPGGPPEQIWRAWLLPFLHMWFLGAMLLVFAAVALLDRAGVLHTRRGWGSTLVVGIAVSSIVASPTWPLPGVEPLRWLNALGATMLFPFVVLGVGVVRFGHAWRDRTLLVPLAALLVGCVVWQQAAWRGWVDTPMIRGAPIMAIAGLAAVVLAFTLRRTWRPLAWLGNLAYPIYLLHILGVDIGIVWLPVERFGSHHVAFVVWVVVALAVPLTVNAALYRFGWARLVLGLRDPSRATSPPPPALTP